MVMMSKLAATDDGTNKQFKPKIYQSERRNRQEISMTDVVTIKETIGIVIDQIAEIKESTLVVEFSTDRIIEVGQGMNKTIGMTIGDEILEATQKCIKIRILEDRIIEVDTEEIIGMKIMKEVGVGLEKGCIQVTLEGMTEAVVIVGQG